MIEFSADLMSARSPSDAFDHLADMAQLDRWNPNVTASRRTSGDRLAVGSTYRSTIRRGLIRMTAKSTLVAVEPGRSVRYEGSIAGFWSIDALTFEPHGKGTRITFSNRSRPPRWLRVFTPLLSAAFAPQARRAVEGARQYLHS